MYSLRKLQGIPGARNVPVYTDVVSQPELPMPEPEMPVHHQMCLLKLRGGDVAKALVKAMAAKLGEPSNMDWRSVIDAGYVRRSFEMIENGVSVPSQWGKLINTPSGDAKRRSFTAELCRAWSIHIITRTGGPGTGIAWASRCSCGQFSKSNEPNDRFGDSRLRHAEDAHLRSVEKQKSVSTVLLPHPVETDNGAALADVPSAAPHQVERRT
jgi:hypothetical protein